MKIKFLKTSGSIIAVLIILGIVACYIDSGRVTTGHEPKLCIKVISKDGGKVTYFGLGYKVVRYVGVSPNEPYENNIGVKMGTWFMRYELPERSKVVIENGDKKIEIDDFNEADIIQNILENSKFNRPICDGIVSHEILVNDEKYLLKESCLEIQKGDKQAKISEDDIQTLLSIINKYGKEK